MLGRLTIAAQIAVSATGSIGGHRPTLSALEEGDQKKVRRHRDAGCSPAEAVLSGLKAERKLAQAVFRRLVDDGTLIRVGDELFLHAESHRAMRERVLEHFAAHPTINVGTMKDLFALSRKYAIPYLEHLDASRITRRQGDERVPYK
jgi:selenocysteine-specific elongation factor